METKTIEEIKDSAVYNFGFINGVEAVVDLINKEDYANTSCMIPCSLIRKIRKLVDERSEKHAEDTQGDNGGRIPEVEGVAARLP